jgi:hypothetical protein
MRRLLFGTLCFFLIWAIPAVCCDCNSPADASRYIDQASIAFTGKVVFTNDDGSGKFTQNTLVRFEVEEAFKGLGPEVHDVWIDPGSFTSCYAEYHVGKRYLVFAYGGTLLRKDGSAVSDVLGKTKPVPRGIDPKNPPKVYSAPECSGSGFLPSKPNETISRALEYLRKYKERAAREQGHHPLPD